MLLDVRVLEKCVIFGNVTRIMLSCTYLYADPSGTQHPIVMVAYKFDGVAEHKVLIRPHGQSMKQKAFYRTAASVKTQLSKALVGQSPKDALDKVLQDKGGGGAVRCDKCWPDAPK